MKLREFSLFFSVYGSKFRIAPIFKSCVVKEIKQEVTKLFLCVKNTKKQQHRSVLKPVNVACW